MIDWGSIAEEIRLIADWETPPADIATIDQSSATVRDIFDAHGLTVADDDTVYVALVTIINIVRSSYVGMRKGELSAIEYVGIVRVVRSWVVALLPHVPEVHR